MPAYEYQCTGPACGEVTEVVSKLSDYTGNIVCPQCGCLATQIITAVTTHDDHPLWLNDEVRAQIQGDNEPKIETRTEYARYMKEKGYVERDRRV